ncbi:hypothetical protein [Agromyces sp. NPDC057865]|uniref:hypothetical protein n=1 Tax=Agromyces sp. NPDC057865 TaxID=3346267 RepID=UPI00366F915B
MDELPVIGADIVHLNKHTFMWVQVTHFGKPPEDDMSAIAALIASPGYADDYASPLQIEQQLVDPPVHGRWWLNAIQAGSFEPTTAAEAEERIRSDHGPTIKTGSTRPIGNRPTFFDASSRSSTYYGLGRCSPSRIPATTRCTTTGLQQAVWGSTSSS